MTAVEFLVKGLPMVYWEDPYYSDLLEQAKEMENNSYICSKCKSQINGKEIVQQMQDSEKSD